MALRFIVLLILKINLGILEISFSLETSFSRLTILSLVYLSYKELEGHILYEMHTGIVVE